MKGRVITRESHRIQVVLDQRVEHKYSSDFRLDQVVTRADEVYGELQPCMDEINNLIGLSQVKKFIREIYAWLKVCQKRRSAGLTAEQQVLHMVFTGNPGTGKTTVARIIGRLFKEMEVLSTGHLVEVERADLVGEYIGHTAQKTREHVRKALGGILFIDEAYALARGGEKDFGKEAIDTLVKAMEDHKNDFVLILAGYPAEMDRFIRSNPGLPSRFPIQLNFPDFTIQELIAIGEQMLKERQYRLSVPAREKLKGYLLKEIDRGWYAFGNARHVRNVLEQAIRNQAVRLLHSPHPTREELMILRAEDFQFAPGGLSKSTAYSWYT